MRFRALVGLGCATALTALSAGSAMAGEITGNGKSLEPLHASSICAYSGLNDEKTDFEPTRTQTYGTFLVLYGKDFIDANFGSPGQNCRGNVTPPPEG